MENKNIREKYEEEIYRLIYDTESMDACQTCIFRKYIR